MSQMSTFAEQTCSDRPAPKRVSPLTLGLCSDSARLTSAQNFSDPKMQGNLQMNAGDFELSDCWSSEQQPATYYRTAAAQARRLQANATTPRVKQYLDEMITHCERLARKVERDISPSRSTTSGRAKRFIIGPRSSKSMTRSY